MKKRVFSLLVVLAMIVHCLPVYAVTGSAIVSKAREQIGKPYSSSNRLGPDSFDCSGLVHYVCNQLGISMSSGNCNSQMNYGTAIDYSSFKNSFDCSNLQEGDLIFFDYGGDGVSDHVGIYSGNGNMIDALTSSYYGYKVVEHSMNVVGNSSISSTKKFYQYTCAVRRVTETDIDTTPPTNPNLRIYTNKVAINKPILFEYSVNNADTMYIAIDVNGIREHFIEVSSDHYNGTFTKAGHYEAYLYAVNSYGNSGLSNCVSFDVYDSAPSSGWITADKNNISVGDCVNFSFGAKNANEFQLGVFHNGNRVWMASERNELTTRKVTFSEAGIYKIYVSSYNEFGYCDSETVTINVYDKIESTPTPTIKPTPTPTPTPTTTKCFRVTEYDSYADVENTASQSRSAVVIIAKYNGNLLEKVNFVKATFTSGEKRTFMFDNDGDYKVFVWDSINGMFPLNI